MDHRVDPLGGEQLLDRGRIADIGPDKPVLRPLVDAVQVVEVAGIGQPVEVDQPPIRASVPEQADEIGADEAAAPGHQDGACFLHGNPISVCIMEKRTYSAVFFSACSYNTCYRYRKGQFFTIAS